MREITVENVPENFDSKKLEQKFFIYGDITNVEYDKDEVSLFNRNIGYKMFSIHQLLIFRKGHIFALSMLTQQRKQILNSQPGRIMKTC